MLVKMQLEAANATISQNLYLPYLQDGRITLQKAEENPDFDPELSSHLCIVYNETEARNVELYVAGISKRL